ncbi:hypothetical protein DL95DRAFT_404544 [Leptodontidium sp. 2 PMI_412]|nr:hypothetical protein DL95DRAFT_404544 [Leptodontidium sp. 2 PMI_412]
MTFNGTIGGIPIIHEGTIQEVVAHMTHKYPGFALDISADITNAADTSSTTDVDAAQIIPRYNGNWGDGKRYEDLFANCQWIATFAGDINRDCFAFRRIRNGDALTRGTCGQEFSRDSPYNVINHYDRC